MSPVQQRYLDALHYCRVACDFESFTMTSAIRQFKVTTMFATAAKELGLLERVGSGRCTRWKWIGGMPTEKTAAQLAALVDQYNADCRKRMVAQEPATSPTDAQLTPEDMRIAVARLEQKVDHLLSLWS